MGRGKEEFKVQRLQGRRIRVYSSMKSLARLDRILTTYMNQSRLTSSTTSLVPCPGVDASHPPTKTERAHGSIHAHANVHASMPMPIPMPLSMLMPMPMPLPICLAYASAYACTMCLGGYACALGSSSPLGTPQDSNHTVCICTYFNICTQLLTVLLVDIITYLRHLYAYSQSCCSASDMQLYPALTLYRLDHCC